MNFAPLELEIFQKITFQQFRLSVLIAFPLLVTLAIIIYLKKVFSGQKTS